MELKELRKSLFRMRFPMNELQKAVPIASIGGPIECRVKVMRMGATFTLAM